MCNGNQVGKCPADLLPCLIFAYQKDQSLIGGMVIRIGDRIVDSSIRTKLEELQKQLMKIQLG